MDNKAKPILFSTPMVQAIMDGRKTMTRRAMKPQPVITANGKPLDGYNDSMIKAAGDFPISQYQPGDVLWVRETWREYCVRRQSDSKNHYCYKADHERGYVCFNGYCDLRWRPSIFMPREACRLFLRVTGVRVEKLQSITNEDGKREGVCGLCYDAQTGDEDYDITFFKVLWNALNAKRGYGWDTNPWVWVYTFERCEKPEGWCK